MTVAQDKPLYLRGHLGPVVDEIDAVDLPVTGTLPPELVGRYFRNGPNPLPGQDPGHWFAGQGMLHGVRLAHGRAEWYRNRWVRTAMMDGRPDARGPQAGGAVDRAVVTANTSVVEHGGRILALVENGFPYLVTPELDTIGADDFGGRLTTAMTAHPKTDPSTGDLHFFGYGTQAPHLTYHRLSAAGDLVASAEVPVKGPTMMHDFAITGRHAVFLDLPMTFQRRPGVPFGWDESYGARLGVMPLDNPGEVTWFEVEPCYVFHVGNAHETPDGRITLDVARYSPAEIVRVWTSIGPGATDPAAEMVATGVGTLHRWTLDPAAGTVTESDLSEQGLEFPTVDDQRVGRHNRYLYAVSEASRGSGRNAILSYDLDRGGVDAHDLAPDVVAGEAVFVASAAPDRAENDGWLISITTTRDGTASDLLVLDATDVGGAPVARVALPRGVPAGFHGSWIPDPDDAVRDAGRLRS